MRRWGSSRSALVPSGHLLQELNADYAHGPLEVLRPGSDNGRKRDSAHADEGLRLEVAEERHGVGGNVGSGIGVTESRGYGRCNQSQAGYYSGNPCDSLLVDGAPVGQLGFNTGLELVGRRVPDPNAHEEVQVRDGVGNSRNLAHEALTNVGKVGFDGQRSSVHWAHAVELLAGARVELLGHGKVTVDVELHLRLDLASDIGDTLDVEAQTAVVWRQGNVE